ncbi:hypothetical protein [Bacteroides helcogenes]|nr:hypothetical protein [Bacteroides helcogenes]MDY5239846.1 hypothetical protein [Bacteroides helcogenes]
MAKLQILRFIKDWTFLTQEAAIAPGTYLMWQNIINSWQIWRHK